MLWSRSVAIPVIIVVTAYSLWREWRQIRGGTTYTVDEQTVLGFQMILVLLAVLSGLTWFLRPLPYFVGLAIGLVLGVSLLFIALTSIIYRVSIFRGRGQSGPQHGGTAIVVGVAVLFALLVRLLITQIVP